MKKFKLMNKVQVTQKNLLKDYAPLYIEERKNYFYEKALKKFGDDDCILDVSRWECEKGNLDFSDADFSKTKVSAVKNYFHYDEDVSADSKKVWFLNFADYNLFGYYDGMLFAQDEIQTLEHPLLGSVCEMLYGEDIENLEPTTAEKFNFNPRPYLVQNVPWWIRVDTSPDRSGINVYGSNFRNLPIEDVKKKVGVVDGKFFNNIIAVAAPTPNSYEEYSERELEYIIQALVSSFGPAKKLSGEKKCVIHTGNWGCGAFGGNRELMYLVQLYVANLFGVDEIVFHAASDDLFVSARQKLEKLKLCHNLEDAVECLLDMHFVWGESDGN